MDDSLEAQTDNSIENNAPTSKTTKTVVTTIAPFSVKTEVPEQSCGKLQATVNPQPSETIPLDLSSSKGSVPLDLTVRNSRKDDMDFIENQQQGTASAATTNVPDAIVHRIGRHLNLPTIARNRPKSVVKISAPSRILSKPLAPSSRIGVKTIVHKVSPMRHGMPTTPSTVTTSTNNSNEPIVLLPKLSVVNGDSNSTVDSNNKPEISKENETSSNFASRFLSSFEKRQQSVGYNTNGHSVISSNNSCNVGGNKQTISTSIVTQPTVREQFPLLLKGSVEQLTAVNVSKENFKNDSIVAFVSTENEAEEEKSSLLNDMKSQIIMRENHDKYTFSKEPFVSLVKIDVTDESLNISNKNDQISLKIEANDSLAPVKEFHSNIDNTEDKIVIQAKCDDEISSKSLKSVEKINSVKSKENILEDPIEPRITRSQISTPKQTKEIESSNHEYISSDFSGNKEECNSTPLKKNNKKDLPENNINDVVNCESENHTDVSDNCSHSDKISCGVTTRQQSAQNSQKTPIRKTQKPLKNNALKSKTVECSSSDEADHSDYEEDNVSSRTRRKTINNDHKTPPSIKKNKSSPTKSSIDKNKTIVKRREVSPNTPPAKRLRSNSSAANFSSNKQNDLHDTSTSSESELETPRITRGMSKKQDTKSSNEKSKCKQRQNVNDRSISEDDNELKLRSTNISRSKQFKTPEKNNSEKKSQGLKRKQLENDSQSDYPLTNKSKRCKKEKHDTEESKNNSCKRTRKKKKEKKLRQSTRLKSRVATGIFAEDSSSDSFVEQDDEDDEDVVMNVKMSTTSGSSLSDNDSSSGSSSLSQSSSESDNEQIQKRRRQPMLRELRALFPDEIPKKVSKCCFDRESSTSTTEETTICITNKKTEKKKHREMLKSNINCNSRNKVSKNKLSVIKRSMHSSPSSSHISETVLINSLPMEIKKLGCLRREAGETPLHKAARKGNERVVKYCLQSDHDLNARDNAGFTPLHESCLQGYANITSLLLRHGADVNAVSLDGLRPLRDAIESDKVEIVRLLLAYGADLSLLSYAGADLFDLAQSERMKKLLTGYLNDSDIEIKSYQSVTQHQQQKMSEKYAAYLFPTNFFNELRDVKVKNNKKKSLLNKIENEIVKKWHDKETKREQIEKRQIKNRKNIDENSDSSENESDEDDTWENELGEIWTFPALTPILDEETDEGCFNVLDNCPLFIGQSDDVIFEFSHEPHLNAYQVTIKGITENYVLLSDVMSNLGVGKEIEEEEDEFIKLHYTLSTICLTYKEFLDGFNKDNSSIPVQFPSFNKKLINSLKLVKVDAALRSIMSIETIVVKAPINRSSRSRRASTISMQKAIEIKRKRKNSASHSQFSNDAKTDTDRWIDKHFSFSKLTSSTVSKVQASNSVSILSVSTTKEKQPSIVVESNYKVQQTIPPQLTSSNMKAQINSHSKIISTSKRQSPVGRIAPVNSFPLPSTSSMSKPQSVINVSSQQTFWQQQTPPPYNAHQSFDFYNSHRNLSMMPPHNTWNNQIIGSSIAHVAAPWDGGLFNTLSQSTQKSLIAPTPTSLPSNIIIKKMQQLPRPTHRNHLPFFTEQTAPSPINGHSSYITSNSSLVTHPAPPPQPPSYSSFSAMSTYRPHHDILSQGHMIGSSPYIHIDSHPFVNCITPYTTAVQQSPTTVLFASNSRSTTPFPTNPHYASYHPQF